jgi:hypothetical protein
MAVDKLVDSAQLESDLTDIADAIRAKTGKSASMEFPTEFVSEIGSISGGGTVAVEEKDVTFYDYDGTPVASYTESEAYALTALPANPSHSGLVAQGWNWTLAEIKAQIDDCPGGTIDVGQLYITDDGKTRLYIHIPDNTPANRRLFYVGFSATQVGGVTIDWGDGNTETNTTKSLTAYPHTYATSGRYIVTLDVTSGFVALGGSGSITAYGGNGNGNAYNRSRIVKLELGANAEIDSNAFDWCTNLESVTLPATIRKGVGDRSFQNVRNLSVLIVPKCTTYILSFNSGYFKLLCLAAGTTNARQGDTQVASRATLQTLDGNTLTNSVLYGHSSLKRVVVPQSVTVIPQQAFYNCWGLTKIVIPSGVTKIRNDSLRNCFGMGEIHLKPTTPPTMENTNVINGIPSDCIIYVPYSEDHSILEAYQTATNWSTYASKMQEETS